MTRTILRLALCVGCGLILATVTSLLYFYPFPRWVWPVAELLNWPVAWVYFHIFPTMDEYPPFISSQTWLGVAMFFVLAVPVYSALLVSPLAARWFIRMTRSAAHTPGAFILYFLAGSVVGGIAGFMLWATSWPVGSPNAMLVSVGVGSFALGWTLAVIRAQLERCHRG